MRQGRVTGLVAAALVVAGLAPAATTGSASADPGRAAPRDPYGTLWNILPPGSNGTATAVDVAKVGPSRTATPTTPTNFADQLEMYDALTRTKPSRLTAADIGKLYKTESFTPQTVVSTETPRTGVTIRRDSFGVPYIKGKTFADTEFGAGFAGTEDRMFLMDVLRHAGQARLTEFAGDSPGNVAQDREQLASAYYTRKEATAQIAKAAQRAGAGGPRLLKGVDAFLAGINAAQQKLCPDGNVLAPTCPAEYAALQKTPQPWTRADIVYIASLVGGIFGKGGGNEYADALWLQRLEKKFGHTRALRYYDDLREKNDPEAPTTATTYTPYERGGIAPGKPGVALPDLGGKKAPGTGAPEAGTTPLPRGSGTPSAGGITLDLKPHGMSNAILVTGKKSATGKPLAVMGPQTGYYAPQLLTEEVLDGPHLKARGVAFAGTNLFVQLGRGVDYAWSATSAGSDNIDTVAVRLCNQDGSAPTVRSTSYRHGGKCVPMYRATHTETTTPNIGSPNPPKTYRFLVLRTEQGIVQTRTTVHGRPVALVKQRSTYGHEVDSVIGFSQFNDPTYVHGPASFQRAASHIDYTFNWFYDDSRHISYYSSGLLPKRSPRVDSDLPYWAGHRNGWRGWLGFAGHAHQTDPGRGYLVSWNNKPAPGFGAADDNFSYGSVYRSLALEKRLKAQMRRGKLTLTKMVGVMSGAATADSRAAYTLPLLLKVIGHDPRTKAARKVLRSWLAAGAPRVDRDRSGSYGHQAAIALFDGWWQHGRGSVAYDVLKDRLGLKLTRKLPQIVDDHPRLGRGSAFNGVAWYGYVDKDLRSVLGRHVRGDYHVGYCGRGHLAACRHTLRASLRAEVKRIKQQQGVSSVRKLTYDKSRDDIRSTTAGVIGVRPIDWQNRPTFQQVIAFFDHR